VKSSSAAIKVGLTALLVALVGYGAFKFLGKGLPSQSGYVVWALFRDATGLVEKSRVQIAGLVVGEIADRRLQGSLARVDVRIKPEVKLWSNAAIYKRTASLLGEFYLEIDPGTPESPDPLTGSVHKNFPIEGCAERTGNPDCAQIRNVVEAVTTTDVLLQVSETLPVLRDILRDVQEMTQGPMKNIAREVETGIHQNSDSLARLIENMNRIVVDVERLTTENGPVYSDIRSSMTNVREITESLKDLIGTGQGQVNTAGDKIKRDLDQLSVTLEKLNRSIDEVNDVASKVNRGEGTVGKLLTDDTIARNVGDITEDAAGFVRSVTRLQTIVGISEEMHCPFGSCGSSTLSWKTYLSLKLQPRPDKYYEIELIDDPRGSHTYNHQTQVTTTGPGGTGPSSTLNIDTFNRTSAFRFSFLFAKRIEGRGVGLTARLGIKESTGGGGAIVDFWGQRLALSLDLFDFVSEQYPRVKVMGALEMFKHVWLLGGVDDVLNSPTNASGPVDASNRPIGSCGPATPAGYCQGGRDWFVGARLSFNDEDLRALLTVGGAALSGLAGGSK